MRLLLIHSDHIESEARKKTKVAEEDAVLKDALDEALAVFCAVESIDEENIEDVIQQAADEIVTTARRLGTTNIMIYPYAHLSSDLASPEAAVDILRGLAEAIAGSDGFVVRRAPFGWYKAFSLSCKGHRSQSSPGRSCPGKARPPRRGRSSTSSSSSRPKGSEEMQPRMQKRIHLSPPWSGRSSGTRGMRGSSLRTWI